MADHPRTHLADPRLRQRGWSDVDLYLPTLWPAAGWRAPRYLVSAIVAALMGAAMFVALTGWPAVYRPWFPATARDWLAVTPLGLLLVGVSLLAANPSQVDFRRLDLSRFRSPGARLRLVRDLAFWLVFGLVFGLACGLAVGPSWLRYLIAQWLLARSGRAPRRIGEFVDWAYEAGLLRLSGIATQFRHQELQQWLTPATGSGNAAGSQARDVARAGDPPAAGRTPA